MIESARSTDETMAKSARDYVRSVCDPFNNFEALCEWFHPEQRRKFLLCNAGTRASEHEGISAAGLDPAARRLTPAVDAEALVLGRTISAASLPVSPLGIVSPVVISRACLRLMNTTVEVIDSGSFKTPELDCLKLSAHVAECPSTGQAIPEELVERLFDKGQKLGEQFASENDYIVIAECVPGGTTTAMAVMTALGYEIDGLVSSSLPTCNHEQRSKLVHEGIAASKYSRNDFANKPLLAVSSVGDPMQAVITGITIAAAKQRRVFLAGGSQMLAVWALLKALSLPESTLKNITVITTTWVAFDPSAGVQKLAQLMQAPMVAACPNFWNSRHSGLQAYEEGNVKEGVGAGASMCLAYLNGFSPEQIQEAIDNCYDELATRTE